jgi:hypothetical protein
MDRRNIGILLLIGLGVLGFWFFTRKTGVPVPTPAPPSPDGGYVGPGGIQPLRLMPAGSLAKQQYINEENWEWIDWKGQNRSLTVHRKLTQL